MFSTLKALPGFTLALLMYLVAPTAYEQGLGEDTLKALYSYKFALFTDWPVTKLNDSNNTFGFCIIGRNPFGQAALDTIQDKPVKNKPIQIEVFNSGVLSEASLNHCHIAYISHSESQNLPTLLSRLHPLPILTISDISNFSAHGGMITLVKSGEHIQFQINPNAVNEAGLSISSKIIELATLVNTTPR
ncbi:YfiR family protein [Methylocucumis oryzae]|uniref:Transmembrane protein n=1 Tax=Methylocucumis oryzae TaxID=1632867 RepID=A0A0F3IGP6_9GAMM|nr:YfiR family protein [Methylocucumis oryzae]KJV05975.1 hypothetical protein VZ94_14355 [Methylocucumis oryzae]